MPNPENDAVNVIMKEPVQMVQMGRQRKHLTLPKDGAGVAEQRIDGTQEDKEEGGDIKSSYFHNYMQCTENTYKIKE